jgi:hypothetical protein
MNALRGEVGSVVSHRARCVAGLAAMVVLGVASSGCGSTAPVTHRAHPSPSASAKATPKVSVPPATAPLTCKALPPTRYTVAQATSNSFQFNIPAVADSTAADVYAGTSNVTLPANWEDYIPHIPVVNATVGSGAVSNCVAQEWGYAYVKMIALDDWASTYGSPSLEQVTALSTGSAPQFYGGAAEIASLQAGNRQTLIGGIYPTQLILVQLTQADQTDQQTTSSYAFVEVDPSSDIQATLNIDPSGTITKSTSAYTVNGGGLVVPGNFETSYPPAGLSQAWPFGSVFLPSGFQMCSADGVTQAICGAANVG